MRPDSSFDQTGTSVNKHVNLFLKSTAPSGCRDACLSYRGVSGACYENVK